MSDELKTTADIMGFFIKNLDIPNEVKSFLFEVAENIENKQELETFIKIIEDFYVKQTIIENDSEFQKQTKKIDNDTLSEINQLLTK